MSSISTVLRCGGAMAVLLIGVITAPMAIAHETQPNFCGQTKPHPIDAKFDAAMEASGGVTADMRDAQSAAYDAWDKELNRIYGLALKKMAKDKELQSAFRTAQRSWLAWHETQGTTDWALYADSGTSGPLAVSSGAIERIKARVCELQGWLDELEIR